MEFWIRVHDGCIVQATFTTDGCGHSILSGSACAWLAEGKSLPDAMAIDQQDVLDVVGGLPDESRHCALLAADTLRAAATDYARHSTDRETASRP